LSLSRTHHAALLAFTFASLACALDISKLEPRGYVSDFAGVLDATSSARIETYCGNVERSTGAQFAVVLVKSLEGDTIEEASVRLFEKWGIGKKEGPNRDEGILLLFAMDDHKNRIEVGFGLEPIVNDAAAGDILRSIRPILRQGDFGGAIYAAVQQLGQRIAAAKGVTIEGQRPVPRSRRTTNNGPGIGTIVGFAIFLFVMFAIFGGRKRGPPSGGMRGGGGVGNLLAGMILGNILSGGRRGGGWSQGGFGGSGGSGGSDWGGGGGFGGFGGGGSGGGGASGGW